MAVTNEPAPHGKLWGVEWQQLLARQQNNASLTEIIGDGSTLEGDLTTVEGVVAALVVAVGKLNTVVDTTSATSDYELSVNETAMVSVTAATTALNIAVEDGVYEISGLFDSGTFGADQDITLQANNTTYAGEFLRTRMIGDTAIATDEYDQVDGDDSTYAIAVSSRLRSFKTTLVINGLFSTSITKSYGITAGSRRSSLIFTWRSGSAAHTSLGTLSIGEAATGVVYVKRIA